LSLLAVFPVCQDFEEGDENTREFLRHIIEILLDFITETNNRETKGQQAKKSFISIIDS